MKKAPFWLRFLAARKSWTLPEDLRRGLRTYKQIHGRKGCHRIRYLIITGNATNGQFLVRYDWR
jgi:hypothetical protein